MPLPHDPYSPADPEIYEARVTEGEPAGGDSPPEGAAVPKGSSSELLGWVDGDKERAQRALDAERATSKPRKGLVEELEEILSS